MPKFLAHRELVLHSPPVLYALLPKLASGLGQVPKFLAYGVLVLHSSLVLPASLPCLPSFALQNSWIMLST